MQAHHEISKTLGDYNFESGIYKHLTVAELKTLSKTRKLLKDKINNYVYASLFAYWFPQYQSSPYDKSSPAYDTRYKIPGLASAKRALELALVFKPACVQVIVNVHPEIIVDAGMNTEYFLTLLLSSRSHCIADYLKLKLFKAIDSNDINMAMLISSKIENISRVENQKLENPLFVSTFKALKDKQYLPLMKYLLCRGYLAASRKSILKINDLVEKRFLENMAIFSDKNCSVRSQIRQVFKVAKYFQKFIFICKVTNCNHPDFFGVAQSREFHPEKILLKAAKLDKCFFNQFVNTLLEKNGNGILLNKHLDDVRARVNYFCYLYIFIKNYSGVCNFTAETLERIADTLQQFTERKIGGFAEFNQMIADKKMISFFYQMAMSQESYGSDCYNRIVEKLSSSEDEQCDPSSQPDRRM